MYSAANRVAQFFDYLVTRRLTTTRSVLATLLLLAALFTLAVGITSSSRVYAQTTPDISGIWRGTLIAGQFDPLEIVFHIHGDAGNYSATLDIPAQSRLGLPVDSVSVRASNIIIRMDNIQAEYYAGLVMADDGNTVDALDGDWGQSGEHIPLRMRRDGL